MFFYLHLFKAVPDLISGKGHEYSFMDGPYSLIFKPIYQDEVLITFDWMEDSNYFPKLEDKREQLKEVPIPFNECIDELYNAANEYTETLIDINPKLVESEELKELMEARDKAKKAIEEYKKTGLKQSREK